jgi:hypothetical protein
MRPTKFIKVQNSVKIVEKKKTTRFLKKSLSFLKNRLVSIPLH